MLLAEQFVSSLVKKIHGHQHSASTDEGGTWYPSTGL